MATRIKYKGETLETLTGGKATTLHTCDTKMKGDIRVEVDAEAPVRLQDKTITENGEHTAASGYDGLGKVTVAVPVPEGYVKPSGTKSITENGTHDVSGYASAEVDVAGGGAGDFNIAYGDTAPEDTTKLWVKTAEPEAVQISPKVAGSEYLENCVATLPTAAYYIAAAAVGTKVYLFGGYSGTSYLNTINVYDTETDTITTLGATLPTGACDIAAVAVGTKIYLFGGMKGNYGIDSSYLKTINVFDTENHSIGRAATLPITAAGIPAAAVGTKVYLFGGRKNSTEYLNTINVYDTETGTITTLSVTQPTTNAFTPAAAVGTKVYLLIRGQNTINVYDTETGTITTLGTTLPTKANNMSAAAVGTKVYLFGGSSNGAISTINALVLSLALAENNLLMEASLTDNLFNLLPSVEIGVANIYKGNADGVGELVAAALYKDGAWTEI